MKLRTWSMLILFIVALTVGACAEEQAADAQEEAPIETEDNIVPEEDTAAVEMEMNVEGEAGVAAGSDQDQ